MQESTFRYVQLNISAKRLPGRGFRLDPIAVVHVAGSDSEWVEVERTEKRLNEWSPTFSKSVNLPADGDRQRRAQLRVDFYHKAVSDSRFIGYCETNLYTLLQSEGTAVELELNTSTSSSSSSSSSSRIYLTASEGYTANDGSASFSLQMSQTNFYGVAMTLYYEISRAANQQWQPVYKSSHTPIDEQGWGQFAPAKVSLRDLTMDEDSTGLLFSIYRYRKLGSRKLIGRFQGTLKQFVTMTEGDFLPFSGNAREDLLSADVQVLHASKTGSDFDVSFKLVNCVWRAPMLAPP